MRCSRLSYVDDTSKPHAVTLREARVAASADAGSGTRLTVRDLVAGYRGSVNWLGRTQTTLVAVNEVSFEIAAGHCLAVVGESGSGKTTLARCIAGLHAPASGEVRLDGELLAATSRERDRAQRRSVQMVFQDPDSSLNPSMSVGQIIGRPLRQFVGLRGSAETRRVGELLELVRLPAAFRSRAPRTLSGGEKQRVALPGHSPPTPRARLRRGHLGARRGGAGEHARAPRRAAHPARDVDVVYLARSRRRRTISDEVLVLESGHVREANATEPVFTAPTATYTRALLDAIPDLRPEDYPTEAATRG